MKLKSLFKKLFGGLNLVLLLVVVLGFAGNLGGGLEVEAAMQFRPINKGNSSGIVVISDGNYAGITSCTEDKRVPNIDENGWTDWIRFVPGAGVAYVMGRIYLTSEVVNLQTTTSSCAGYALSGETLGQPYSGSQDLLGPDVLVEVQRNLTTDGSTFVGRAGANFGGEFYLLGGANANHQSLKLSSDELSTACENPLGVGFSIGACVNVDKLKTYLASKSQLLRIQSALSPDRLLADGGRFADELKIGAEVSKNISTNGAVCRNLLDSNGKSVFYCVDKDGKPTGPRGEPLPTDCKASTDGKVVFRFVNGGNVSCLPVTEQDAVINDPKNKSINIGTSSEDIEKSNLDKAADAILDFVIKVASIALALVLYIFTLIGLIVLFFFGVFVLWLLDINPAALNFVDVAQRPWGLLASVGNILILGAFMYVGFGYMMGIANMKKSLGDFLLKIVYYAMLLNFTLLGAATIVNVGYGVGNLIKFGYASSSSKADVNQQLMGNIIGPIGRVSYLRCPNPESPECNFEIADNTDVFGQAAGKSGGAGITSLWKDANTAIAGAVAEGVTLVMIGFALYVFWKALYVVFYRIVALWMLMILSPIALASYFSPVDEWKGIGTEMFSKFWKLVLFYPAFIFALVLVNTMSGAFNSAAKAATGTSTPAATTTTPFSVAVFAEGSGTAFQSMTLTVLGAGVALMGLWIVVKYFTDSFEADMGKIGGGIKAGYEGAIKGYQGVKKGVHTAFAPMRLAGSVGSGVLKKGFGIDLGQIGNDMSKSKNGFARGAAMLGRTTRSLLTGRTLYDIENKANSAKKLWTGLDNIEKRELAGQKSDDEIRDAFFLRNLGLGFGGLLDASGSDPTRALGGVRGDDLHQQRNNLMAEKNAGARGSVVEDKTTFAPGILEARLRAAFDKDGNFDEAYLGTDEFSDTVTQALKGNVTSVLQAITSNETMLKAARGIADRELSQEEKAKAYERNGHFRNSKAARENNAAGKAGDPNYTPSGTEMMDEEFFRDYMQSLKVSEQNGEKDASERIARALSQRQNLLDGIHKRAYQTLHKSTEKYQNDYVINGEDKYNDTVKAGSFYNSEVLKGNGSASSTPSNTGGKITNDDYITAANVVAQGVHNSGNVGNNIEALLNQHPELRAITDKVGDNPVNQKHAIEQAFKVAESVHSANQSSKGLVEKKGLLEKIKSGGSLSNTDKNKLAMQGQHVDQILDQNFVQQVVADYQASAQYTANVAKIQADNVGISLDQAKKMAIDTVKKSATESAKVIKKHMSDGLNGVAGVDAKIDEELGKFFDSGNTKRAAIKNNAQRVVNGQSGGWAGQILNHGNTQASAMSANIDAEISSVNQEIRQVQEKAIEEHGKLKP